MGLHESDRRVVKRAREGGGGGGGYFRVRFFGRIQKRTCDPRSYGFFATNKTKNPKKDYFIMTR